MRGVVLLASAWGSALLSVIVVVATRPGEPRADLLDTSVAKTMAVGDGGAIASCDRVNGARNGRVASLPFDSAKAWEYRIAGGVDRGAVVTADGDVVVVGRPAIGATQHTLVAISDGRERASTVIDPPAAPPILLANGLRVVMTVRGEMIGVDAGGAVRFRERIGGEGPASVAEVGLIPLPSGGFGVARRPELVEVDGAGAVIGRTRLEVIPAIAARSNGEILAVTTIGELYTWRAGRVPRLVGTFGERGAIYAPGQSACPAGPVLDGDPIPGKSGRRERAICTNDFLVEQIDLGNGTRRALLAKDIVPFRTPVGVGANGAIAVGGAGGAAFGLAAGGAGYGPLDPPGQVTLAVGRDAGAAAYVTSASGELPPLVANDGAILFGSSDGIAIAHPGALPFLLTKCSGNATRSVAGVTTAGPGRVVVVCADGRVTMFGSSSPPPKPPKKAR